MSDAARTLEAAFALFRRDGYAKTTLDAVAASAGVPASAVIDEYRDKAGLLTAVLRAFSPHEELRTALSAIEGETAEDLIRDSAHRVVKVVQKHAAYFELATLDMQLNGGGALAALVPAVLPQTFALMNRLNATGHLRPVATPVLARTFVAMLIGFIASEKAMPGAAQFVMRLFTTKTWLDSMVDLLLYGVLEDDQR
jgi:TetR/AcrR family transcriptional repressor of mexJK operon